MGSPVILCGKTAKIGEVVIANLKPEFDGSCTHTSNIGTPGPELTNIHTVIHFVMSREGGKAQIPAIFKNETPATDSELGSKVYTQKPVAVILGGGYDDEDVRVMMEAAKGLHPVPWLRPDQSKPAPPLGPGYGEALVERIKVLMVELEREGKMGVEEVVWF